MLLTDEEIIQAMDKANGGSEWREDWEIEDVLEEQDRGIAKAQLKKVVEDIEATQDVARAPEGDVIEVWIDGKYWQSLLEEVRGINAVRIC